MALWDRMPPNLAEIPYGFKNLWRVSVSSYNLAAKTFPRSNITNVTLNGSVVSADQMRKLYDYNRDGCSLSAPGAEGLYVTLAGFEESTGLYSFDVLIEQNFNVSGVLGVFGDMVDSADPQRPVVKHDDAKLDVSRYDADQTALGARLATDEANIQTNANTIGALQRDALIGVTVNGASMPVAGNTAQISIDAVSSSDMSVALASKVDKAIAGAGNRIVQNATDSLDPGTRTLTLSKNLLSLEDGSTQATSQSYDLAQLLGVKALEAIDKELFYFCADSALPSLSGTSAVPLTALYRHNADGTTFVPAATDNIQLVFVLSTNYSGYSTVGEKYIGAIGNVISATAATVTCRLTNLSQFAIYNKYNGYRAGTVIYDPSLQSTFQALQNVPAPSSEATAIAITNALYYAPIRDYSLMEAGSVWANFEDADSAGQAYPVEEVRLKLLELGSGYNEYVGFTASTIPSQILTEADWSANVSLWVTDGNQFTSLSDLLAYLSNFPAADRFKISNRGIVRTHYEAGGITITPVFTLESINAGLSNVYQPIPGGAANTHLPVFNSANVLVDSGKSLADLATAAQGAKADTAIQSATLTAGGANGTVALTVDGIAQNASVTGLNTAAYRPASDFATAAQGTLANSAVQSVSIAPGTANGTVQLTVNGVAQPAAAVEGINTAAFQPSTAFATSAQGALADSAVQAVAITTGEANGTIDYSINGGMKQAVTVGGIQDAAYRPASAFATAAQGNLADTALQPADVVDNLASTQPRLPLSANQGRVLEQMIQSLSPNGKPIGGFQTFADAYERTTQYPDDLQPININDTIYIAADENHTDQPAQYRVASIGANDRIVYSFMRILPDAARDFSLLPIQTHEIANGAVGTAAIQNGSVIEPDIADQAVSINKLSGALQTSVARADNSLQSPMTVVGTGTVVRSVTQNASNALTVTYGDALNGVATSGSGDFITGGYASGSTITLTKDGKAFKALNVTGSGNAIVDISATSDAITATKGNTLTAITKTGSGNTVADISTAGVATMDTRIADISKSGTGKFITGVTIADGEASLTSADAYDTVATVGTGNAVGNITASGSTLTLHRINAIDSIPDATTGQKGIVQLNNTLVSTATSEALTAAQGKALNDKITQNDALYVKLVGNQTIADTKTFSHDPVVPAKSAMPVNPSTTTYATEAQVGTRIAKPPTSIINHIAVFDGDGGLADSGVPHSQIPTPTDRANWNAYDARITTAQTTATNAQAAASAAQSAAGAAQSTAEAAFQRGNEVRGGLIAAIGGVAPDATFEESIGAIQSGKATLAGNLTGKGVPSTAGQPLADLAAAVAEIPSGGGGGFDRIEVLSITVSGTYSYPANTKLIDVALLGGGAGTTGQQTGEGGSVQRLYGVDVSNITTFSAVIGAGGSGQSGPGGATSIVGLGEAAGGIAGGSRNMATLLWGGSGRKVAGGINNWEYGAGYRINGAPPNGVPNAGGVGGASTAAQYATQGGTGYIEIICYIRED